MMRKPKMPPAPLPPPPPRPIPTATAANVQQAAVEEARRNRGRSGRMSTMLTGSLGDGDYAAPPPTERKTMLG